MENDLCQNHPLHNYNMLITYFIKEVDCSAQKKSCGQRHLERGDEAWNQPLSLPCPSTLTPLVSCRHPCHQLSSILALAFYARINCLNVPHKNASKGTGLLICSSKGRWWVVWDHMTYPQCSSREAGGRCSVWASENTGKKESKGNI